MTTDRVQSPGPEDEPARDLPGRNLPSSTCPHCQAEVAAEATRCWLCDQKIAAPANPYTAPPSAMAAAGRTFGLASLMLIIALVAVILGVGREAPGLGVLLAILSFPALLRTVVVTTRRNAAGQPTSAPAKVGVFILSLSTVMLIGFSAGLAFFVTCLSVCAVGFSTKSDSIVFFALIAAVLLGSVAAIAAAFGAYKFAVKYLLNKDNQ